MIRSSQHSLYQQVYANDTLTDAWRHAIATQSCPSTSMPLIVTEIICFQDIYS